MGKVTEFTEEPASGVGGTEWLYIIDGSTDRKARISSLKSLFASYVANLTTLKATAGSTSNQIIHLIGGVSANDSKAGTFYWDKDLSSASGNDDDVVAVTGLSAGCWVRLVDQQYVNTTGDVMSGGLTATGDFDIDGSVDITDNLTVGSSLKVASEEVWREANLPKTRTAHAWVCFSGGTENPAVAPAILDSYNIAGVSDGGKGIFTINMETDCDDGNYGIIATAKSSSEYATWVDGPLVVYQANNDAKGVGSFLIRVKASWATVPNSTAYYTNPQELWVAVFANGEGA
jgi:hypothetical protein